MPGSCQYVAQMPFVEWLMAHSVQFPNAASTSPWTVPSHASLFTGLYPWEHRVHRKSGLILKSTTSTIAETLHESGYATFAAAANSYLKPESGLLRGFESAAWGSRWERFLPAANESYPFQGMDCGPTAPVSRFRRLISGATEIGAPRLAPIVMDTIGSLTSKIRNPTQSFSPIVSPWIEPTFDRWISRQSSETPIFAFFNLYEAHEPYFLPPELRRDARERKRFRATRMDRSSVLAGRWAPTEEEYDFVHRLYQATFEVLDRRIQRIFETLRSAHRWENTLFVLTSDHGQAFGEHHFLYHEFRIWDAVVRIPMYVRFPHNLGAGQQGAGWASLVDVVPTILQATNQPSPGGLAGRPLQSLISEERPEPVWAIADGAENRKVLEWVCGPERAAYWDRELVTGFTGTRKVILDVQSNRAKFYNSRAETSELGDSRGGQSWTDRLLSGGARERAELLGDPGRSHRAWTEQHLRGWGYL